MITFPYTPRKFTAGLAAFILVSVSQTGWAADRTIIDRVFSRYETNLRVDGSKFYWISNDRLLTTVDLNPPGSQTEHDQVVLIDANEKKIKILFDNSAIVQFDHVKRVFRIAEVHGNGKLLTARDIQVNSFGDVGEIKALQDGAGPLDEIYANRDPRLFGASFHDPSDGYFIPAPRKDIPIDSASAPYLSTRDKSRSLWVRKGKSDIEIEVPINEISEPQYIDFLGKYLLDNSDSAGNSNTDSHMNSNWPYAYEFSPTRLLSDDGQVETIPYPYFLYDFGVAKLHRGSEEGRNFSMFTLTKPGMVLSKLREDSETLYLYSSNQLYRIAYTNRYLPTLSRLPPGLLVSTMKSSLDGCRLAYSYANKKDNPHASGPLYLMILDLCK